jgi:two-component system, NarL family, response regulator NreC
MDPQEITIVLADDHVIVREGLAALCASKGLRVVGECSDGASAVEMVNRLHPDFAVFDLDMPGLNGVEAIHRLRVTGSHAKLMILSVQREEKVVVEALRAGADAYLLKDGPSRHLMDAISFVRDGGVYISPLLRGAGLFTGGERILPENPLADLSPREIEVFTHLVNGLRAKDIADLLSISPKTVDTYRAGLMRKLKVRDLVGLVKFAIERNLTSTSVPR